MSNDRIERTIDIRAPQARVWRAISDSAEFGSWFGMRIEGRFEPGRTLHAQIATSVVDSDSAKASRKFEGLTFDLFIERVDPETLLSFRWHPHAVVPGTDYSAEPTTLVTFRLQEVSGVTRVTVTESGFEGIPADRRAQAFSSNGDGWTIQVSRLRTFVESSR